ncbi:MAG: hypothetical protein P8L46_02670 [Acidimicrobiales bacterium]|nr:hypothetical protein [Acidimicrobiales bacterium]MDG2216931.1 hypothetical protein [Acidimicrobiales bacterium]
MPHPIISVANAALGMASGAVPRRLTKPIRSTALWSAERASMWAAD